MVQYIEEKLIKKYHEETGGALFKEVLLGQVEDETRISRVDGLIVDGEEKETFNPGDIGQEEFREKIYDSSVHVIEAKRHLNRNLIGQIEVAEFLLQEEFNPAQVTSVIVCLEPHSDLTAYCEQNNIKVKIYDVEDSVEEVEKRIPGSADEHEKTMIDDIRSKPNDEALKAFKRGWRTAAQKNILFEDIEEHRTHTNAGNLFGWIYGEAPEKLIEEVWKEYIAHNRKYYDRNWN